ncbi:uncharacterized protein L203_101123 [Cryptococcus depauperatus CBS 7841]|uniref:Uncharacterized protein n=1 Tax=Cryptococcus depauperatus CBS 7841 TaxID=1295531 RepID=A0A1E3IK82_9TREE|nr:hypothetical protein L203_02408 [Cryptococcus depauperatus CBS 7841]
MSIQIDISRSEKARADGNASFKKGRWAEAIGHYTNAVVFNPQDPIAYCNRALAYLKLDKFKDAERDCSSALELPKGESNVKALYRRGMARKGQNRAKEAIEDMEQVLHLDKQNEAAKAELRELKQKLGEKEQRSPKRPCTPPNLTAPAINGQCENKDERGLSKVTDRIQDLKIHKAVQEDMSPGQDEKISFTTMRQSRDKKKSSYIVANSSSNSAEDTTLAAIPQTFSPSKSKVDSSKQYSIHSQPVASKDEPSKPTSLPPLPSTLDVASTSPGAGLSLLRHLTLSPPYNFSLISLYPPANIPKILGNLLEPDTLGLVLMALKDGSKRGAEDKARVRVLFEGLRATKRWKMNTAMLSTAEKEAGQEAWEGCGGVGKWIEGVGANEAL